MATLAFKRRYELTLAKPIPNTFFGVLPNAIIVRGLEIKFKVERSLEPTPNTAEVSVYNLSDAHRAEFQKRPLHVRLDVGYQSDTQLSQLIKGDLMFASSKRDGNGNIVTTFTVGDGERAYGDARMNVALGPGTNLKTAIGVVAGSMGLSTPKNAQQAGELLKQFSGGLTMVGPSRKALGDLLRGTGFGWSIQDGQLQLLRDADTHTGLVEVISVENGLIESPEYSAPKEPGKPPVLKAKRLLRPQIAPGTRVKMESKEINGFFRVIKVAHTGDFRDNDWYTEIEANPV
jgi:hypothetical protein